jgi:hypothetical protein
MAEPITEPTVIPHPAVTQAAKEANAAEGGRTNSTPVHNSRAGDAAASTPQQGVEPKAPGSPPDSGRPFSLKDIQVGKPDGRGLPITYIYAVQDDEYAIYQAGEVMVHFADDPGKAQVQRKSILPLSSARAEVNVLVQGLVYREVCDRQLAYALQLALDGDMDGAKAIIAAAKAFVLTRRAARGRFQYLKWSFGAAAVMIGLLFLASRLYPFQQASSDLWLAAKAGLVGAAFSIALAIRKQNGRSRHGTIGQRDRRDVASSDRRDLSWSFITAPSEWHPAEPQDRRRQFQRQQLNLADGAGHRFRRGFP